MPSFPSDIPGGAAGGAALAGATAMTGGMALPIAMLGTAAAGTVIDALGRRRAQKRANAQQERILNEIDTGASQAKAAIAGSLGQAQGGLMQQQINAGTVNSSLAPGQAAGLAMQAGGQMGQIDMDRARQRAEAISSFASAPAPGGSPALGGVGNALGVIMASRGPQAGTTDAVGGSAVSQAAAKTPAIDQSGGDPGFTSLNYQPAYDGAGAGANTPVTAMTNPLGVQQGESQMGRALPLASAMGARSRRRNGNLGKVGQSVYA